MRLTIFLTFVCVALVEALIITISSLNKTKRKNEELEEELKKQNKNSEYICQHEEENKKIEQDRRETESRINEAKSDEEVFDVINSIVNSNNSRVQKRS